MPDSTISRRLRWSGWIAVTFLLLLTVLVATPFLLTTRLANLALGQFLPDNRARIGSASLSLAGKLILRDVVINDSGGRARQPLATARKIDVGFGWRDLFARRLGWIRVIDVTLYARTDGHSQLSLIDLVYGLWRPSTGFRASPIWIGTIEIHGGIRQEGLIPREGAGSDLPMALQMIMSGDRARPSRHFTVDIGNSRQRPDQDSVKPSAGANPSAAASDSPFEMVADIEIESLAEGTRVVIHRLAAAHAALTLDADTLRNFVVTLPPEMHGRIETGLENLSASGTVDVSLPAKRDHLAGSIAFSGLRVRTIGDPKMALSVDDLAGAARIESNVGTALSLGDRAEAAQQLVEIDAGRCNKPFKLAGRALLGRGLGQAALLLEPDAKPVAFRPNIVQLLLARTEGELEVTRATGAVLGIGLELLQLLLQAAARRLGLPQLVTAVGKLLAELRDIARLAGKRLFGAVEALLERKTRLVEDGRPCLRLVDRHAHLLIVGRGGIKLLPDVIEL